MLEGLFVEDSLEIFLDRISQADSSQINKFNQHIRDAKSRVESILKTYPPETHYIVGWGINMTIEAAVLKVILGDAFADYFMQVPVKLNHDRIDELTDEEREKVFTPFLPKEAQGKKVVVMRHLVGGAQLHFTLPHLIDFYARNNQREVIFDFTFSSQNFNASIFEAMELSERLGVHVMWNEVLFSDQDDQSMKGPFKGSLSSSIEKTILIVLSTLIYLESPNYNQYAISLYPMGIGEFSVLRPYSVEEALEENHQLKTNAYFSFLVKYVEQIIKKTPNQKD